MKTSTVGMLSASALAATIIGFGVAAPSIAEETGTDQSTTTTTEDAATDTEDTDSEDTEAEALPEGDLPEGPGPGHGPGHGPGPVGHLDTAAETLGLSTDELVEQLHDGSTLGDIADEAGVDRQTLVDAILADQEERVTEMLDESFTGPPADGPAGGPGGRPDRMGDGDDAEESEDAPTLES
ncbi:hypothetical protein ACI3EY_14060 [Ornithinimicrobium sp. LYQ92]|uniref:hypothetical protein n=1 Tax=Serinicoccus sp. LYQ92 TaxID=3378798 RepID=UPI00385314F2